LKHHCAESFNADLRENNKHDGHDCQDVNQKPEDVLRGMNIDRGKASIVNYAN